MQTPRPEEETVEPLVAPVVPREQEPVYCIEQPMMPLPPGVPALFVFKPGWEQLKH